MDFERFYHSLPKFTRFYMITVFVMTFIMIYIKLPIVYYLYLDFDLAFGWLQIWRLITNFFLVGKFSFNFVFFMMMIYNTLSRLEKKAVETRRYAEFVMLLVYLASIVLIVTFLTSFLFGIDAKPFLNFEMLFALIYVESKRDPEKMVMVWFMTVKNAYVPFVLLFFSLITGGDIFGDIIGIAAGHIYYYLKDIAPLSHNLDLLKTPQFLINYFDRAPQATTQGRPAFRTMDNQNSTGSFSGGNTNSNQTGNQRQDSTTTNRFQAFSGRGTTWSGQ